MLSAFLLISLMFIASLVFRRKSSRKLCAICAAVALSWLILLVLYKVGSYSSGLLVGILMGQSITGFFYFGQKRLPKALRIFTLPYFLSMTAIAYFLISDNFVWPAFLFLAALWVIAWLIFINRSDPAKKLAETVIDCCED